MIRFALDPYITAPHRGASAMGKSDLDRCVESLYAARDRAPKDDTLHALIKGVFYLVNHCQQARDEQPPLYLRQISTAVANLTRRLDDLEAQSEPATLAIPDDCACLNVLIQIQRDCEALGWDDCDASIAWDMGRAAMQQARGYQGRFPHDPPEKTP